MSALQSLETSLDDLFVKKAPPLPAGGKKALVQYLPWINLALGVLSLWAAYALWHWAHVANDLINYANSLSTTYGGQPVIADRLTAGIWLGLIVLVVEAVIYIAAFAPARDHKKLGWDLMFYAMLVNVVYGVVILFTDFGGIGSFLGSLIGSAIGLYLLFQIRSSYGKAPVATKTKAHKAK